MLAMLFMNSLDNFFIQVLDKWPKNFWAEIKHLI